MKILKKTKARKDAKIAAAVKDFLTKFKLKEKIDLANQWADAHKKKVTVITEKHPGRPVYGTDEQGAETLA